MPSRRRVGNYSIRANAIRLEGNATVHHAGAHRQHDCDDEQRFILPVGSGSNLQLVAEPSVPDNLVHSAGRHASDDRLRRHIVAKEASRTDDG
jgi:hypothetical protein